MVLWDVPTGMQKAVLATELNYAGVTNFSFSADGRFLASSHRDGTVRLFDVVTAQQKTTFTGHTGEVYSISFSPDGKTLASACGTELWLWDVTTRKYKPIYIDLEVYNFEPDGSKIYEDPVVFNLSFSPDGKTLATAQRYYGSVMGCRNKNSKNYTQRTYGFCHECLFRSRWQNTRKWKLG